MKIVIRPAKFADWKIIQQLNYQLFLVDQYHDDDLMLDWPFTENGLKYYQKLARGKNCCCLLAEVDDEVVAYVAIRMKDFGYRKSQYVEVENICVDSKFRSQGIGAKLMTAAADWGKEHGASKIYVESTFKNIKANKFYKSLNFSEIGLQLEKKI